MAGASGVGTVLIQMCKWAGASSIAVCSSWEKLERCKSLGSFDGINHKQTPNYQERLALITDGEGVDVLLDPVCASFFNCNLECLGMDSRWVIYGTMGGIKIQDANMAKLISKRASILTSTLRNRTDEYKRNLILDMERDCFPGFKSGDLNPIIDKSFDLTDASSALSYM